MGFSDIDDIDCSKADDCPCPFCRYERREEEAIYMTATNKKPSDNAEGTKHDKGKPRFDLFPFDALEEIAQVLTGGANKYGDHNWEQGINYGRVFAAALRHLSAFWQGREINEEDFGCHHLAHAACCCLFLLTYRLRHMDNFDDRPRFKKED